jgi:predicted exporter
VGLAVILFLAMGVYIARNLELSTGIAHLLSESSEQELALVSSNLVDSSLTRSMVLAVSGPDLDTAMAAARQWAVVLDGHPEVASLRMGPDASFGESVFELYFPRRLLFLSSRPERELPERLSDAGLERAARRLLAELASPRAQLIKEFASADPLLAFPDLLDRFDEARRGALDVVDGQFVDPANATAVLFLTTRHSAFDAASQSPFEAFLAESFAGVREQLGTDLRLERSGVHRFAVASEERAHADMQRISVISIAGIVLLFMAVFRSPRLLVVSFLPLLGGVLTATSVGIGVFGKLHVMTLVFGSTLLGVCIDYPIHYVSHHTLLPAGGGPRASLARVWGAIAMGAFTTVAGFVGLAWSDFPGVREIGVFAATGILGALITTRFVLPPLLSATSTPSSLQVRVASGLARLLEGMGRRRGLLLGVLLVAGLVIVVGLSRLSLQDDVFALSMPPEPSWVEEDRRVRARVTQMDPGRFVVALGADEESALRRNDAVFERLETAQAAGELEAFRSLHSFLFSEDLQTRNSTALRAQPDVAGRMLAALETAGFRSQAFAPFAEALDAGAPTPLGFTDLAASPLADLVASFRVDLEDRVAILTLLRGVSSGSSLMARLADLEGVHYFDQQSFLREIYGRYRSRAVTLIGVGLAAVVVLLYIRYRRIRLALATAVPALVAAASTLALLTLMGTPINLLHLLGLLLVLSIGVDYSIFLVESESRVRGRAAAMLSLVIACLSTCLAFGLLSFSSFPALRALGVTTGIGVLLSLLLAPTVLVVMEPGRVSPELEA